MHHWPTDRELGRPLSQRARQLPDALSEELPMATPMSLTDVVHRSTSFEPWSEADGIPWNDPEFSARMLREHLSQQHHQASRRTEKIESHVAWIHNNVLGARRARVLDLACGPGLYAERLAAAGHGVVGIDFSPASIAWAKERARESGSECEYQEADLRSADFGRGFGLAMLIFGQLNAFRREAARGILSNAREALGPGGKLILEVHTPPTAERVGSALPRWRSAPAGLFGDAPHLVLEESQYSAEAAATAKRYFVVDAASGVVQRYAETLQGYSDAEYDALLGASGFRNVERVPSLAGEPDPEMPDLYVLLAS